MLVVPDKFSLGVRTECGFARAWQAEKQRDVARFAFVGAGMHRKDVLLRQ